MGLDLSRVRGLLRSVWALRLLRLVLGGLFVYAGALKLSDPNAFAIQLGKYGLLPAAWLDPASYLLPLLEMGAGFLTLLGRRGGAETLGVLLLVFLVVLSYAWWAGLEIPCGCFSAEDEAQQFGIQRAILRDLIMLAGVAWLLRHRPLPPC